MTRPTSEDTLPILFKPAHKTSWSSRVTFKAVFVGLAALSAIVAAVAFFGHGNSKFANATASTVVLHDNLPILTPNPIIGIHTRVSSTYKDEFIAASYVKWVESAGGRAVRIPYNASEAELTHILNSVNGVLFPGGDGDPNEAAEFIYKYAIELNDNGTYFPVWGTCLGFEWLVQLTSKNYSILDRVDAANISSSLQFQKDANRPSRIFNFSPFFDVLATAPLTDNFHDFGIFDTHFAATESLTSFYNPTATSVDRQGRTYVAVIEALNYPFYGTQFHPEKNAFEFGEFPDGRLWKWIDHTYEAILASQSFGHFFIQEARRNNHKFPTTAEQQASLLYNVHTSNRSYPAYVETLVFP
ncbi:unnamed protein product [Aphanomyces euteiches]|uniref:folate gamma-glutamyl hydrolase n=1 Tax=Aphanomyces euteiches TaxID=100861 RepID=A0A6G0XKL6_9STRA|nr:hypothetical protein Ae201684_003922 [Aphanomyces euteiches]KAH9084756.1 hypothetical protein Ae201684P_001996 [Aphanomyces euteiches]KAH9143070.1 hypothetical protein AeRB84_012893 [Aphanomyces euteiches]